MSEVFRGVVQKLPTKPGKYAGSKVNFISCGGDNFFNAGFSKDGANPKCFPKEGLAVGDTVEIEWEQKPFGKTVLGTVNVVGKGEPSTQSNTTERKPFVPYSDPDKQASIEWQSARKDAVEVVIYLHSSGVVDLGKPKNKMQDNFINAVLHVTERFFTAKHQEEEQPEEVVDEFEEDVEQPE